MENLGTSLWNYEIIMSPLINFSSFSIPRSIRPSKNLEHPFGSKQRILGTSGLILQRPLSESPIRTDRLGRSNDQICVLVEEVYAVEEV